MATIHVNKALALSLLRLAVADKGRDYIVPVYHTQTDEEQVRTAENAGRVYENHACRNFKPNHNASSVEWEPSCIIGHCLSYLGFTAQDLESSGNELNGSSVQSLYRLNDLDLSREAETIWQAAQTVQDRGQPWGQALAAAEEVQFAPA